jgi:hypothetical protein
MRHILTLVGSSPQCKVRLAAPGVSPFHCSLLRTVSGVWIVNLVGHEGVALNGSSIRAMKLGDGDNLKVGDVLIRLFFNPPHATANGKNGSSTGSELVSTTSLDHLATPSRELTTNRSQSLWMDPRSEFERDLADRSPAADELSASLLALVLDQFGQMQQQFLDQFQQTTLMLFRALGTMHRDQMDELREKLDSLHQLSENLQALTAQMAATTGSPGSVPPAHEGLDATSYTPGSVGTTTKGKPDGGQKDSSSVISMGRESCSSEEKGIEQLREKVRSAADQPNNPSLNVHEWLIGRLTALEDEQRGRWQKILDLLRGR